MVLVLAGENIESSKCLWLRLRLIDLGKGLFPACRRTRALRANPVIRLV